VVVITSPFHSRGTLRWL